jgi:FemAB-related protein (PEP-CTERM system-associated)
LSEVRSPLFGNSMVSAGFGVGGGILAEDPASAQALAGAAWALAEEKGCTGLELRGGAVPDGPWRLNGEVYANFAADLPQGDEAILLAIKKRQRAEIRRSLSFGLTFTEGTAPAELDAHYRTYAASVRNLGTPVFPRALFEAMATEFGADAHILTAWKDGRPLSSVFSFFFKGSACPYWGGGTAEARQWRANEAVYYELMCRAARRGCARFDFGRSKVGTGPYAFKKNWGFEPAPLVYATRTADGVAPRQINPTSPKYRLQVAAWKRLPLWLANVLGPPIARGLG